MKNIDNIDNIDSIILGTGVPEYFWVVTEPSDAWDYDFLVNYLDISDICFRTGHRTLMAQALGGLKPKQLLGVFSDEAEAKKYAATALAAAVARRNNAQR
jgi:hypothetical protein